MGSDKKTKRRRPCCPQPGDSNYKTPTQLRNARKRRKLQRGKITNQNCDRKNITDDSLTNCVHSTQHHQFIGDKRESWSSLSHRQDPSLKYINDPKAAPTVQAAKQFFEGIFRRQHEQNHQENKFSIVVGPTQGWRTVARLAVRSPMSTKGTKRTLDIGLFVPGSHHVIPVPQCQAHHPHINTAVNVIQRIGNDLMVQPFDETTGKKGNLRYVAISVERATGKQQVVLVWNEQHGEERVGNNQTLVLARLIQRLIDISENRGEIVGNNSNDIIITKNYFNLHSLWVHYNNSSKHSNSIFDRQGKWEQHYGGENGGQLQETLFSDDSVDLVVHHQQFYVPLYFPPQVFRQANLDGFAKLVAKIRAWLIDRLQKTMDTTTTGTIDTEQQRQNYPKKKQKEKKHGRFSHCLELYGGVGTIGLHLVDLFDHLISSDENPYNQACFEISVDRIMVGGKSLRRSQRNRIVYHSQSATDMVQGTNEYLEQADVVIVDPPRKGLDQEVLDALKNAPIKGSNGKILVYVSCGFAAFRRDYQGLVDSGRWILEYAEGHVLFPGSDAIETLAFFTQTTN
jgi:23S rRNA (uracil1939-C5)-methyltransferase